jgi:type III pantothenate kinase
MDCLGHNTHENIVAVDIGNSRTKFGVFRGGTLTTFTQIDDVFNCIAPFPQQFHWRIARTGSETTQILLENTVRKKRSEDTIVPLLAQNIPLKTAVDFPEKVGVDRLLAALAARKLCSAPEIMIVDAGSAVTVDVVAEEIFQGGAILAGLSVMAEALTAISPKLPLVSDFLRYPNHLPSYPAKNTEAALQSGVFWSVVGAAALFHQKIQSATKPAIPIYITGGDAEIIKNGLSESLPNVPLVFEKNLVLLGIINSVNLL